MRSLRRNIKRHTMGTMYGLWEHLQLWRLGRASMPSSRQAIKAWRAWERVLVGAYLTGYIAVFSAVWATTGNVLIAAGALLVYCLVGLAILFWQIIRSGLRGEEGPPGTVWDGTKFVYHPRRSERRPGQ